MDIAAEENPEPHSVRYEELKEKEGKFQSIQDHWAKNGNEGTQTSEGTTRTHEPQPNHYQPQRVNTRVYLVRQLVLRRDGHDTSDDQGKHNEIRDPLEYIPRFSEVRSLVGSYLLQLRVKVFPLFRPSRVAELHVSFDLSSSPLSPLIVILFF